MIKIIRALEMDYEEDPSIRRAGLLEVVPRHWPPFRAAPARLTKAPYLLDALSALRLD